MIRDLACPVIAAICVSAALTACSSSDDKPERASESVQSSESTPPTEASAEDRGLLEVFTVVGSVAPGSTPTKPENRVVTTADGETLEIGGVVVEGDQIAGAEAVEESSANTWVVDVLLTEEGARAWAGASEDACLASPEGQARLALVVGEDVVSAPSLANCGSVEETDRVTISGSFTQDDAEALVGRIAQSG